MDPAIKITELSLSTLPFGKLNRIGDLSYMGGPLMTLFESQDGKIIIYDWVDIIDEAHRWLVYQTDLEMVDNYIKKRISRFDLINGAIENRIFLTDIDSEANIKNVVLTTVSNLGYDYIPSSKSKFREEDCPDLEEIKSFIAGAVSQNVISSYVIRKSTFDIIAESQKNGSEVVSLYLKSGRGVKSGHIYASTLGSILSDFNKLSQEMAFHIYDPKRKKGDDYRRKKGERERIRLLGEHEYMYSKTGSFNIILKPATVERKLFDQNSHQTIIENIYNLFNNSDSSEKLTEISKDYGDDVLRSYKSLLSTIKKNEIKIDIDYANPVSNVTLKKSLNYKSASDTIDYLKELQFTKTDRFTEKGKFKAIDLIDNKFKFEPLEGEIIEGNFSDFKSTQLPELDLKHFYIVDFEAIYTKKAGKHETDIEFITRDWEIDTAE